MGRVEDRKEIDKFEIVVFSGGVIISNIFESDSESMEIMLGKFFNIGFKLVFKFVGFVMGIDFNDDISYIFGSMFKFVIVYFVLVSDFGMFVNRVEGFEVEEFDISMSLLRVREGINDIIVNGVLVFGMGSIGSEEIYIFNVLFGVVFDIFFVNGKFVGGESIGFVGIKDGDISKFFDGSDMGNDSFVFGELLGIDGKGDG